MFMIPFAGYVIILKVLTLVFSEFELYNLILEGLTLVCKDADQVPSSPLESNQPLFPVTGQIISCAFSPTLAETS